MTTQTKESQAALNPNMAWDLLKEGNQRFVEQKQQKRDLLQQVSETSTGQYPFATILSCIDSRVSAELIFDQGVGDIFSARVAGNIVNEDILGSIEFACKLAGTKIIVVLGHTSCGAVKGACDDAKMGNLTELLSKIKPAVEAITEPSEASERTSKNTPFVNAVAEKNVHLTIENMRKKSPVLKEMEQNGEILIVGGMYDISNGKVSYL
ncbi:carbonic anhydrase family protein [Flagellimonas allohymeniacidonis]|uniref:Carbonic anhydrase n=1 Tax=Flagellimonas allohymeniacidonis TaxID=2517819 RepID=A0A4Q8QDE4_9FLAO|nr:carbonic anhydrase family protein [Allomuricauda hymeniacidonis]TAI47724.1 carbonic anhydrase [Allomuricauda hymeniacidonis]